ncbi:FAD-dependent oxidoreductase [Streptomyces sp. NPDC127117]|uniref:FAD-dependent oxidoreductase n=1 Tax=Streptomyces sp. NPDC127117 TaxID=3345368 RepID=UPI00362C8F56
MLFALAEGKGFLAHREIDGSLHVYTALTAAEDWLGTIDFADADRSRAGVLARFDGWDASPKSPVANADGRLTPRKIDVVPVGHRWNRVPGVTLLGDAAHLMSPFAGEGADLAMLDGAELGQPFAAHPNDPERALTVYEEALFPRGAEKAAESAAGLEMCFGDEPVTQLLRLFTDTPTVTD